MDFKAPLHWAAAHPVPTALGVVVLGLGFLYVTGALGGGGSSDAAGAAASAGAYYQAQELQAASNNQVQMTSINANAAVTLGLDQDSTSIANNTTWANNSASINQQNNNAAIALAPYSTQNNLIDSLTAVAGLPPTTSTTTKKAPSLFGISLGTSKTSTVQTANPAAVSALNQLEELLNGFQASH